MDDAALRTRLEQVLDGYFDVKTTTMVERVVGTATSEQLADADEMDRLYATFVGLLEDRYDRADPGWRASAESLVKAEFDRQVEQAREFERAFDDR